MNFIFFFVSEHGLHKYRDVEWQYYTLNAETKIGLCKECRTVLSACTVYITENADFCNMYYAIIVIYNYKW